MDRNDGEFDPGSERTLAARLKHASRAGGGALAPPESGGLVSSAWTTRPRDGDSLGKPRVIPDSDRAPGGVRLKGGRGRARGAVREPLASWRGKGPPRRRWLPGPRGRTGTLGLRYGPDSCGRQQLRIFRNGGNPDGATPRGRGRPEGCRALLCARRPWRRECRRGDGSARISSG